MLYPHKEGFISCSKVFIILIFIFRCSHDSWTQQYGDSSSTNFINSSNHHSLLAFTSNGKCVYGSYGFAGNPDLIFGLNAENGELLFSNHGYCDKGSYPSGPSVDATGIAYYK